MRSLIMSIWAWLASFLPGDHVDVQDVTSTISTLAILIGGGWAIWMLRREIRNLERTNRASHYSELDRNYTDILFQALERPYLRDRAKIAAYLKWGRNPASRSAATRLYAETDAIFAEQAQAYRTYAFVAMNFVETIRDRCVESTTSHLPLGFLKKSDKMLTKTWQPIIASEIDLHGAWFKRETRKWCRNSPDLKFCLGFCDFVWRRQWKLNDATQWEDREEGEIRGDERLRQRLCQECKEDLPRCLSRRAKFHDGGNPSNGRRRASVKASK